MSGVRRAAAVGFDNVVMVGYFNSLSNALEMKQRTKSVNDKITYAAEVRLSPPLRFPNDDTADLSTPSSDAIGPPRAVDRGT